MSERDVPRLTDFAFEAKPEGGRYNLDVIGHRRSVGEDVPEFYLFYFDLADSNDKVLRSMDLGKVSIISTVNAQDTPVCDKETLRWDTFKKSLPSEIELITVSKQNAEELAEWAERNQLKHRVASSTPSSFAETFGVELEEVGVEESDWNNMLLRAVFVIKDGKFVYIEYVGDQMQEPDYNAAIESAVEAFRSLQSNK